MIFTVVGDPHAQPGNLDKIGKLFDILEDLANPVVILGDLFDTKERISGKVFNYVHRRLWESKLHFTILVGNHDWFNLDCLEHSLETLKKLPNVTIVDKPTTNATADVLFMPYYNDVLEFKRILNALGPIHPKTLIMHQGLIGFDYGNGFIADGNGHGEIDEKILKKFKRVISGHFHKRDGPFLGTPFSHTFGETDQAKYIALWDSKTDEMELCETPFPRHRTIDVELGAYAVQDMEHIMLETQSHDLWRVRLIGTEMQIKAVDQEAFPTVKFLEEPTDGEQVENVKLNDTDSNEQKFATFAGSIKHFDNETTALGLEILREAK